MPHPDTRILDVPLRLGQIKDLLGLLDFAVTQGTTPADGRARDLYDALVNAVPADVPFLRPGSQHWTFRAVRV